MRSRYRAHLQAAVATSAAPYGYTLTIWTSGAVTTHAEGLPTTIDALLFLAGAVAGFALVGAGAHGSAVRVFRNPEESAVRLWGGFHIPSVAVAIAGSSIVVALFSGPVVWPLVGFFATSIYLLGIAAQFTIADVSDRAGRPE
ncbi:MAG TPA: hypothetical protein VGF09_03760 [Solirubrobacterales bacterium]|jgi:hypothetical protein